jgi:hypothetical protein
MKYEQLIDFLEHKMSMSHVYPPLLVRALLDAGGAATLRQLAQVFLSQDESTRSQALAAGGLSRLSSSQSNNFGLL